MKDIWVRHKELKTIKRKLKTLCKNPDDIWVIVYNNTETKRADIKTKLEVAKAQADEEFFDHLCRLTPLSYPTLPKSARSTGIP